MPGAQPIATAATHARLFAATKSPPLWQRSFFNCNAQALCWPPCGLPTTEALMGKVELGWGSGGRARRRHAFTADPSSSATHVGDHNPYTSQPQLWNTAHQHLRFKQASHVPMQPVLQGAATLHTCIHHPSCPRCTCCQLPPHLHSPPSPNAHCILQPRVSGPLPMDLPLPSPAAEAAPTALKIEKHPQTWLPVASHQATQQQERGCTRA